MKRSSNAGPRSSLCSAASITVQPIAERVARAARELELEALLGLAARRQHAHRPVVPARDVVGLELRRQHEVDAEHVVEAALAEDRLGRQQVDDAAVHVEVTVDLDRLDEGRQRDRDPHEAADREVWRGLGAEVVDPPAVHVVDDRGDGDPELAGRQRAEALVERALDRRALGEPGEPLQRRGGVPRHLPPLDIEVVLESPAKREVGHLLGAQAGRPHRAPDRPAGAGDDQLRLDPRLLERAADADQGNAGARPSPGDHGDALALEAPQRARAVGREDVGAHRRAPVHARKREQRAPGAHHEGRVERGLDQLHTLARPAEAEEHVVEVKISTTSHTFTLGDGRGRHPCDPRPVRADYRRPDAAHAPTTPRGAAPLARPCLGRDLQRTVKSACWPAL